MTRWERRAFNGLAVVVSASGLLYLWMKYGMTSDDPFAVVNHPLQPLMLQIHVMSAPWLILLCGVLVTSHVTVQIARRPSSGRWTGLVSLATVLAMIVSGYGLQVFTAPAWTRAMLALHLASGGLFLIVYGAHLVIALRAAETDSAGEPEADPRAI